MTIYYYDELNDEILKHKAIIDKKRLMEIYDYNFKKYSEKHDVKFSSIEKVTINNTTDYIIGNFKQKKMNDHYEVSYTMYKYPTICRIIHGLLNSETFFQSFSELKDLLVETKQEKIEKIRRNLDREIRFFNVMLDSEKENYNSLLLKIHFFTNEMRNLCNYDSELSAQAKNVYDAVSIEKCNEKNKSYFKQIIK